MSTGDYTLVIALAVPAAFLLAFALSFLASWRGPKGPTRFRR